MCVAMIVPEACPSGFRRWEFILRGVCPSSWGSWMTPDTATLLKTPLGTTFSTRTLTLGKGSSSYRGEAGPVAPTRPPHLHRDYI